jgi:hypothetical protein
VTLSDLNREAVLKAIEEFDALGRGDFLRKYLFRPARSYFLILGGRRYDSKAIVGAAHGYLPGCAALAAADFSGGERTVKAQLERLGFVVTSARAVDEHLGRSVRDTLLNLPKSTIEEALAEHDRLGPGAFLAALGYRPAERWILEVDGRSYPPRAVLAAAYHVHTGKKLSPNEGPRGLTDEELQRAFSVHGFAVVDRETTRVLPLGPQCWALCVDPSVYRIEDALREQTESLWTTKRSLVRKGDRVLIWRTKGRDGRRGIVALGEVISDIEIRDDAGSPYWTKAGANTAPEPRVRVRYAFAPRMPLWLDEHRSLLGGLSVAKATGGSVFKVTDEQWQVIASVAGVESDPDAVPTADVRDLERRTRALLKRSSLTRPAGRERPVAVESRAGTAFERDPHVRAWVLQEARGMCELCEQKAPFVCIDDTPYLEVHHVRTLAEGGPDTPENTVALCPNCHRELHYSVQREVRIGILYARVQRLRRQT